MANERVRIAVPDLVSPSYFPAIAAADLGLGGPDRIDFELELRFPVTEAAAALRDNRIDVLAGAAHAPLYAFPGWSGAKLLAAISHNTYWMLVVRSDLGCARNDLSGLRNVRIGAAPGPDLGLRLLLAEAGADIDERGIDIVRIVGASADNVSFGVTAADAMASGEVDGFWANGMGAEVAVVRGTGTLVLDARRGDGPPLLPTYTFPAIMASDETVSSRPQVVKGAIRSLVRAQQLLRTDPGQATAVGQHLFPKMEATMIAELISRDAEFYQPFISEASVASLNAFAIRGGLLDSPVAYNEVVAAGASVFWEFDPTTRPRKVS